MCALQSSSTTKCIKDRSFARRITSSRMRWHRSCSSRTANHTTFEFKSIILPVVVQPQEKSDNGAVQAQGASITACRCERRQLRRRASHASVQGNATVQAMWDAVAPCRFSGEQNGFDHPFWVYCFHNVFLEPWKRRFTRLNLSFYVDHSLLMLFHVHAASLFPQMVQRGSIRGRAKAVR